MTRSNALQQMAQAFGTGRALADELGVSEASVSRWLNGGRIPRWETILAIVELSKRINHPLTIEQVVLFAGENRIPGGH